MIMYLREVGKLSTITLITAAPPILDKATNTDDMPRIPLESSAQYRTPQHKPADKKQNTVNG